MFCGLRGKTRPPHFAGTSEADGRSIFALANPTTSLFRLRLSAAQPGSEFSPKIGIVGLSGRMQSSGQRGVSHCGSQHPTQSQKVMEERTWLRFCLGSGQQELFTCNFFSRNQLLPSRLVHPVCKIQLQSLPSRLSGKKES